MSTSPMPLPPQNPSVTQPNTSVPTAKPVNPQAQTAPVNPAAQVKEKAQKAMENLGKAVAYLPKTIEQSVKQDVQQKQVRNQLVIKSYFDANHAAQTAADQIQKTKAALQQIDQHWQEAQTLPSDDPSKTPRLSYLAQMHQASVGHLKQLIQTLNANQTKLQAIAGEKANQKILSEAIGYDEKNANNPNRQFLVSLAQQQQQGIQAGAEKAMQSLPPPVPGQQQSSPMERPDSQPGSTPQGSQANQPTSLGQKIHHAVASVGEVIGNILIPRRMPDIPGSREYKQRLQERALELQHAAAELQRTQAEADYQEARIAGLEPWQERQKDLQAHQAEEIRKDEADEAIRSKATAYKGKVGVEFNGKVPYGWTAPDGKQYTMSSPDLPEEGKEAIGDAMKAYLKQKGDPASGRVSGLALYTLSRMMQMGYSDNPAMLAAMGEFAKASGVPLTPQTIKLISEIPHDQPVSATTGQPIGTRMPGAPTTATRTQAQTAQRFIEEYPRIRQEVASATANLGPVKGREVMGFLLGTVGSTGNAKADEQLNQLRTDLTFVGSNAAKFHVNSVRQAELFDKLAAAGKNTAPAIQGFLDSVNRWAITSAKQERGYGETPATSGSSAPKGGSDPLGLFK